ncbi:MAG: putative glycosyl transferase [Friedmanniella sp.]|nr:putative glycosyl transferase [Friedmanniella sp.]
MAGNEVEAPPRVPRSEHEDVGPYDRCVLLPLTPAVGTAQPVRLRPVLHGRERAWLAVQVGLVVAGHLLLVGWLVAGPPRPGQPTPGVAGLACLLALMLVEAIRTAQALGLSVLALAAADPVATTPAPGLRVAALTTIVPAVEPIDLVRRTLVALGEMAYEGPVDVWVLDEGGDPAVRAMAASLGVRYFTRHGRPELNTTAGRFRARTKAGNHNAWFRDHGAAYDVVAQVDPDHVPRACFLAQTLGYFRDPDVGFVVAPQVYGDAWLSLARHGAAAQGYLFHGVVQRGANRLGAPLLIGTNHVYRTSTWAQVGGYQDSIIEDHLTSMTVQTSTNPATGRPWRGVYTPDVVAVGQAPGTWTDLFAQQRRWAYGAAEIALRHTPRLLGRMRPGQRLVYVLLQSFYPGVALSWVLCLAVTSAMLLGVVPGGPDARVWGLLWALSVAADVGLLRWLRRFNLSARERSESGLHGFVTTLCTAPVYTAAVAGAALRRPLRYVVTPKGAPAGETAAAFRGHRRWLGLVAAAVAGGAVLSPQPSVAWAWAGVSIVACLLPLLNGRRHRAGHPGSADTSTVVEPCRPAS